MMSSHHHFFGMINASSQVRPTPPAFSSFPVSPSVYGVEKAITSQVRHSNNKMEEPNSQQPMPVAVPGPSGKESCSPASVRLPRTTGKRLTVVLDLDETLVHTEFMSLKRQTANMDGSTSEELYYTPERIKELNATIQPHAFCFHYKNRLAVVRKRPFLHEFLAKAADLFELIAFTAAEEEYAAMVLDELDPGRKLFSERLFRQHCAMNGMVKDLRVLNRPLERTVLVDNTHTCFLFQLANGIPIDSFTSDASDTALCALLDFLHVHVDHQQDVRAFLCDFFKLAKKMSVHQQQQTVDGRAVAAGMLHSF